MQKAAWEPLTNYYLTPDYADRTAAADAGIVLMPWDPTRRPKHWRILDPSKVLGAQFFNVYDVPMVLLPHAFFGRTAVDESGVIEALVLPVTECQAFNIAPTGLGNTNIPGADRAAVPVPLKPLGDTQKIMRQNAFAAFQVRNLDVEIAASVTGFTDQDRIDLRAIKAVVVK